MAHEHGSHKCYCPECGYETEVEAYTKCNTLTCPCCGARLRAKETGEFRNLRTSSKMATAMISSTTAKVKTENIPCAVCGFPIPEPSYVGQQVKCAYCGSINEAIAQEGVTIPTPVFVGIICFGLGVLLGPSVWATTKGGSEWLARKARERLAG